MSGDGTSEGAHDLWLDLPAAHSAARMARQILRQFVRSEGLPEPEIDTIEFVAGELLCNAVDHGGGGSAMEEDELEDDVRMTLAFDLTTARWDLRVGDQGGAEPEELDQLLEPVDGFPDLENERGRGFFLIKTMVDELVVVKSRDGRGLEFRTSRAYAAGD